MLISDVSHALKKIKNKFVFLGNCVTQKTGKAIKVLYRKVIHKLFYRPFRYLLSFSNNLGFYISGIKKIYIDKTEIMLHVAPSVF